VLEFESLKGKEWTDPKQAISMQAGLETYSIMPEGKYRWRVTAVTDYPDKLRSEPSAWREFEVN
jgi:hypothetical protein